MHTAFKFRCVFLMQFVLFCTYALPPLPSAWAAGASKLILSKEAENGPRAHVALRGGILPLQRRPPARGLVPCSARSYQLTSAPSCTCGISAHEKRAGGHVTCVVHWLVWHWCSCARARDVYQDQRATTKTQRRCSRGVARPRAVAGPPPPPSHSGRVCFSGALHAKAGCARGAVVIFVVYNK